ncbi:hypothetical protein CLPUN_06950 [Clostridium puniceum]|uniref:Uncharacterized protein n=1 Tax=Clostridium puniceum TaxID=29367 RepID=A0A1S8TW87_9CLOT|nr:hypothetical protein [Clostridium puniceum]OOM81960.1 hypothetical protein CLPUN_06950 [Clostridium puniceum]
MEGILYENKKLVNFLVIVGICILIIQIFVAMSVLMLSRDINNRVSFIASVLTILTGMILRIFLSNLFELFTGRHFGEMYYRFYSFDKSNNLNHDDKNTD